MLCRLSLIKHIRTTPKSVANTTVIDYSLPSYSLPHAVVPCIVVILAFTFKLSCFAQYGRLFFNWHPTLGRPNKTRLTLSRAPQMASSVCSFLYQTLSRYAKAAVELTDHPNGQRTLTGKNLVDTIAFPDHWLQVFRF